MLHKVLSLALLAAFLGWVAWYVSENTAAFQPLTQISWADTLTLTVAFLTIMIGNGLFLAVVTRAFGINLFGGEWLSLSFGSSFTNYFLPFRGGTGIRALYMHHVHGFPITEFVSSLGVMYLMHTVVNGLLAVAGMVTIAMKGGPVNTSLIVFFGMLVLAGGAMMVVRISFRRSYSRFPLTQIVRLLDAWDGLRSNRSLLLQMWLLMIGIALATVWQCRAAFDAVSIALPWEGIVVYAASKNLATLIGLTPGALGIVEIVSIYLGNVLGYTTVDALSVQGLIRAVAIIVLLIAGPVSLVYLRRRIGAASPTPAAEVEK